jgi:hypothetical protein
VIGGHSAARTLPRGSFQCQEVHEPVALHCMRRILAVRPGLARDAISFAPAGHPQASIPAAHLAERGITARLVRAGAGGPLLGLHAKQHLCSVHQECLLYVCLLRCSAACRARKTGGLPVVRVPAPPCCCIHVPGTEAGRCFTCACAPGQARAKQGPQTSTLNIRPWPGEGEANTCIPRPLNLHRGQARAKQMPTSQDP